METLKVNEEVHLKPLVLSDAADIFTTIDSQREYLRRWLPFVDFTQKVEDSEQYIRSVIEAPEASRDLVLTIRYWGQFAGLVGFKGTDRLNRKTEVGYWLAEECQGKGIVTESVGALASYAFAEMGMNRIQIKCAVGNARSRSIAQRLGFTFEGIERDGELLVGGVFTDIEVYSLLRQEWKQPQR
ncbi:GNAT family protein [uncultured Acetobacteroides sp.]|uniref:GNAT family N-acetyltransferase n=1 Tax=uncultured Acetobacteroides sp. TaxID=1760811 RepID=UPI0029F4D340|nr:GNAT family protein [uncultured Acetobacteroides sp.]